MEISLVMMLLMVEGNESDSPSNSKHKSHKSYGNSNKGSHTVSTTNSIMTTSMTLTSPNKFLSVHFGEIFYLQIIGNTIIMGFIIA